MPELLTSLSKPGFGGLINSCHGKARYVRRALIENVGKRFLPKS
jgi:hypothetical protein